MKKRLVTAISAMFIIFLIASSSLNDTSLLGSWSFNVNGAPWEYNRGTMIFDHNEDAELTGKIVFHTGREITIPNVTLEDEEFAFTVDVDGYDVKAVFTVEEDQIRGQAISIEGNMPFTASKGADEE